MGTSVNHTKGGGEEIPVSFFYCQLWKHAAAEMQVLNVSGFEAKA